jgi:hypothetical protein
MQWRHCILTTREPRCFQVISWLRSSLYGITLGIIWIERNNKVFNNKSWHNHKETKAHLGKLIWDTLVDYVRAAWALQADPGSENETSPGL